MIVAGLQMDIAWEEPEENFRRVEVMVQRAIVGVGPAQGTPALAEGPRGGLDSEPPRSPPGLLVLPEMFATGFTMDSRKAADAGSRIREFLASLATRFGLFVLGGYAEPAQPLPANACSLFSPDGEEILHYRKLHPFSFGEEDKHFVAGDSLATVEVEGLRVTPLICYDLRFPEPFRAAADDTDLYCVIANWPQKRQEAWSGLLRARAMENQAYVLGVNRVGSGGGEDYAGGSVLLDPLGREVQQSTLEAGHSGTVWGAVDKEEVSRARDRFSALRDRRPELYRKLLEERSKT